MCTPALAVPPTVYTHTISRDRGFVTASDEIHPRFGRRASFAGDINGDGFDDTLISAGEDAVDGDGRGWVFVRYGADESLIGLQSVSPGVFPGFRMRGLESQASIGSALSGAGDVNGDGIDDFIIGAEQTRLGGYQRGEVFVVYGRRNGFPDPFDLSTLDGSNGFRVQGIVSGSLLGSAVSAAGDLNGDGFGDIAISAVGAQPNGMYRAGATYIIFGAAARQPFFNLNELDGSNGLILQGSAVHQQFGSSISDVGDFNNDGHNDIAIGAFGDNAGIADPHFPGDVFVLFGGRNYPPSIDVLAAPANLGTRITGFNRFRAAAGNVDGAGDVNKDGIDDLIVGYHNASPTQSTGLGAAVIILGKANPPAVSTVESLRQQNGVADLINFVAPYSPTADLAIRSPGVVVSEAGDIDRDGFDDVMVSTPRAAGGLGYTFVVLGSAAMPTTINGQLLGGTSGHPGFRIRSGSGGRAPDRPVDGGGDFNGDGYADLILGNSGYVVNNETVGAAYMIFGGRRNFFSLPDPTSGGPDTGNPPTTPTPTADRTLVAHHRFLNNVRDSSVYSNRTGKSEVSYGRVSGDIGVNIGAGERVWSPSDRNLNVRGDVTIAVSFNATDVDAYSPVVAKYSDKRYRGLYQPSYGIELLRRGALRFFWIRQNDQFGWFCTTPRRVLNGRRKNNVVVTRKKTTGDVEFWVNGNLVHECQGRPGALAEGSRPLTVGFWSRGLYLLGDSTMHVGSLKIYRRVLSSDEIQEFRAD